MVSTDLSVGPQGQPPCQRPAQGLGLPTTMAFFCLLVILITSTAEALCHQRIWDRRSLPRSCRAQRWPSWACIDRAVAAGNPAMVELRPLIDAVPDHQERVLQDDATIMLLG